ncbi:DUF7683 domain-containing protein [Stigmatella aurantiaca]|uniref:DUF7683 domain-containing protein n=1 Tax=Stigmatella aurantiaca (strain DW4/3-1) TaxID=378806 RepID=Q08ZN4_STIAD|nr:hypothetical protein [Stigmatella aurantiaca]ADO68234.1 uncharacterized protein STAUR_0425 [Stigmatella aurantiaca DW4/3-1]EAU65964.1 hypothetical protein STIAU_1786 [Stigmatella aurantiaca DW4/3-1]
METPETHWIISAFENESSERLIAEHELLNVSVKRLRAALDIPLDKEDPELLYVYPIQTQTQAARFSELLGVPLHLQTHDYFLDSSAVEGTASGSVPPRQPPVRRKVTVFQKGPATTPVFEYELPREPDSVLRASLGHPIDDLGFHIRWRIETQELAAKLAPLLHAPIDLSEPRKYFIEYWDPRKTRPMVLALPKEPSSGNRSAISQHELHGATKQQLRIILGLSQDNPLAGLYPVKSKAQAKALEPFLDQPLDLSLHDYAVNYYVPQQPPPNR